MGRIARDMLDLAARLALRSAGDVEPNPMVGAVIVRGGGEEGGEERGEEGGVIGVGRHRRFGGPHAEVEAIADCRRRGEDPRGATMYVTLEPCAHEGKTPACVDAVREAGLARVVIARAEPSAEARGGAERLRSAGVRVEFSSASRLALAVSAPFVKRVTSGMPWVIAKWAQTIDGRIATRTGESRWISGTGARARVHRLRARVDAILTGLGTVLADDPLLTARGVARVRRVARRVVVDRDLEVPMDCALVRTAREAPVVVACATETASAEITETKRGALEAAGVLVMGVESDLTGVRLRPMLRALWERHGVGSVLVEAGAGLLGSLFEEDLVDQSVVYIAPLLLGDDLARSAATGRVAASLSAGRKLELWRVRRIGNDVELTFGRPGAA